MITRTVRADAASVRRAAGVLREGGLVAFPTETVYGLGARAFDGAACARVYRAKGAGFGRPAVGHSEDLERILAIPRREMPDEATLEEMATFWTQRLERPGHEGCSCRIKRLRPLQAWYMEEASDGQGVLGHIEIGGGKTLVDVLLCMAVPGTKTAVVMIPASLRAQFYADFKEIGKHFVTPNLAGDHGPARLVAV